MTPYKLTRLEKAFCSATDATGAPVRRTAPGDNWHVFVSSP
jgi:hypothetical protein